MAAAAPQLLGEGAGYDALFTPTVAPCPATFALDYQAGDAKRRLPARAHFLLDGPAELFQTSTYTNWHPTLTPLLLVRQRAAAATFITVLEAGAPALPVAAMARLPLTLAGQPLPPALGLAVKVTLTDGRRFLVIDSDADLAGQRQAEGVTTDQSLWVGQLP